MAQKKTTKESAKKTPKKTAKKTYKPEDLKPHHAKPYRKRHYGLLVFSVVFVATLAYLITSTSLANNKAVKSAKELISNSLSMAASDTEVDATKVASSHGFELRYDAELLRASGLDSSDNSLYVGSELSTSRPYSAIKITPTTSDVASESSGGSLTVEYHFNNPVGESADLAKLEAQLVGAKNSSFTVSKSSTVTVSGEKMLKSEWTVSAKAKKGSVSPAKPMLTSYTGVVNGTPITIVINSGLAQSEELDSAFNAVVDSISFHTPTAAATTQASDSSSLSLLDKLMMTGSASAESFLNKDNASERVSLLYGSSVVKIYNFYCMDVLLQGQVFVSQSCSASTGSGFFIGNQGYVATNGHVVVNDPLSIAITYAFDEANKGNTFYFSALAQVAGLTQEDIDAGATEKDKIRIAVEKFYDIPAAQVSTSNKTENILVGLNEDQPDIQKLINATRYHENYEPTEGTKKAQLVDYDYRAIDGAETGEFKASDVALLKIDGTNYPSTKLGNISSLMQGGGLSIIGYPGAASSNPLVESSESRATLTSGKVSSIKNAAGSKSQLIETDATIGHGNSGGPAFNDSGEVVGIATYTIDGSGDGNGVYNYVRDIADFNDLASKNTVDTTNTSQTQQEWEAAVKELYKAHYSKAVKKLEAVKQLYPEHPRVDQLLALAQQKIGAGEEAKDFPTSIAAAASLLGILLIAISILLIVHHSRKHAAYKGHVAAGSIAPPTSLDQLHQQQATPTPPPPTVPPTPPAAPTA